MVAILALIAVWLYHQHQNLQRDSFTSGYFLFGAILFLTAYNVRKFLPFIPWSRLFFCVPLAHRMEIARWHF
jgi:hypothetical protein